MNIALKAPALTADEFQIVGGYVGSELKRVSPTKYTVTNMFGEQVVDLSAMFVKNDMKLAFMDYVGRLHYFDFDEWYGQKDFLSYIDAHFAIKESSPMFVVYFDETPEDHVMIFYGRVLTDLPHVVHGRPSRTQEVVAMFYPEGAAKLEAKRLAKSKALRVNMLDSVVALEQQVDVLTRLVLTMADAAPTKPEWYAAFKAAFDANSVDTLRNVPDLIDDFSTHKAKIRQLQVEYFSTRDIPVTPQQ